MGANAAAPRRNGTADDDEFGVNDVVAKSSRRTPTDYRSSDQRSALYALARGPTIELESVDPEKSEKDDFENREPTDNGMSGRAPIVNGVSNGANGHMPNSNSQAHIHAHAAPNSNSRAHGGGDRDDEHKHDNHHHRRNNSANSVNRMTASTLRVKSPHGNADKNVTDSAYIRSQLKAGSLSRSAGQKIRDVKQAYDSLMREKFRSQLTDSTGTIPATHIDDVQQPFASAAPAAPLQPPTFRRDLLTENPSQNGQAPLNGPLTFRKEMLESLQAPINGHQSSSDAHDHIRSLPGPRHTPRFIRPHDEAQTPKASQPHDDHGSSNHAQMAVRNGDPRYHGAHANGTYAAYPVVSDPLSSAPSPRGGQRRPQIGRPPQHTAPRRPTSSSKVHSRQSSHVHQPGFSSAPLPLQHSDGFVTSAYEVPHPHDDDVQQRPNPNDVQHPQNPSHHLQRSKYPTVPRHGYVHPRRRRQQSAGPAGHQGAAAAAAAGHQVPISSLASRDDNYSRPGVSEQRYRVHVSSQLNPMNKPRTNDVPNGVRNGTSPTVPFPRSAQAASHAQERINDIRAGSQSQQMMNRTSANVGYVANGSQVPQANDHHVSSHSRHDANNGVPSGSQRKLTVNINGTPPRPHAHHQMNGVHEGTHLHDTDEQFPNGTPARTSERLQANGAPTPSSFQPPSPLPAPSRPAPTMNDRDKQGEKVSYFRKPAKKKQFTFDQALLFSPESTSTSTITSPEYNGSEGPKPGTFLRVQSQYGPPKRFSPIYRGRSNSLSSLDDTTRVVKFLRYSPPVQPKKPRKSPRNPTRSRIQKVPSRQLGLDVGSSMMAVLGGRSTSRSPAQQPDRKHKKQTPPRSTAKHGGGGDHHHAAAVSHEGVNQLFARKSKSSSSHRNGKGRQNAAAAAQRESRKNRSSRNDDRTRSLSPMQRLSRRFHATPFDKPKPTPTPMQLNNLDFFSYSEDGSVVSESIGPHDDHRLPSSRAHAHVQGQGQRQHMHAQRPQLGHGEVHGQRSPPRVYRRTGSQNNLHRQRPAPQVYRRTGSQNNLHSTRVQAPASSYVRKQKRGSLPIVRDGGGLGYQPMYR